MEYNVYMCSTKCISVEQALLQLKSMSTAAATSDSRFSWTCSNGPDHHYFFSAEARVLYWWLHGIVNL